MNRMVILVLFCFILIEMVSAFPICYDADTNNCPVGLSGGGTIVPLPDPQFGFCAVGYGGNTYSEKIVDVGWDWINIFNWPTWCMWILECEPPYNPLFKIPNEHYTLPELPDGICPP